MVVIHARSHSDRSSLLLFDARLAILLIKQLTRAHSLTFSPFHCCVFSPSLCHMYIGSRVRSVICTSGLTLHACLSAFFRYKGPASQYFVELAQRLASLAAEAIPAEMVTVIDGKSKRTSRAMLALSNRALGQLVPFSLVFCHGV